LGYPGYNPAAVMKKQRNISSIKRQDQLRINSEKAISSLLTGGFLPLLVVFYL